jgi:hypothetical protein
MLPHLLGVRRFVVERVETNRFGKCSPSFESCFINKSHLRDAGSRRVDHTALRMYITMYIRARQ